MDPLRKERKRRSSRTRMARALAGQGPAVISSGLDKRTCPYCRLTEYPSRATAKAAATRVASENGDRRMRPAPCPHGWGWHLHAGEGLG